MTVVPLVPDAPQVLDVPRAATGSAREATPADSFRAILGTASASFDKAAQAETAFLHGTGGLQEMVVERAQADIVLAIASAAASRAAQSLNAVLNMQV